MRAKFAQNPKVQSILFSERLTSHLIPISIPDHVPDSLAAKIAAFGLTSYSRVVYLGRPSVCSRRLHATPFLDSPPGPPHNQFMSPITDYKSADRSRSPELERPRQPAGVAYALWASCLPLELQDDVWMHVSMMCECLRGLCPGWCVCAGRPKRGRRDSNARDADA